MITVDGIEYLSTNEVAFTLGVSRVTVCSAVWKERLGARKVGHDLYWPLKEVETFDRSKFDRRYTKEATHE
jgi:hypothetical protein